MNVPSKWKTLSKKLKVAKIFRRSRISPKSLFERHKDGKAFIIQKKMRGRRVIIAFGALWDTESPDWYEMGTIWVDTSNQGMGVSLQIFSELLKLSVNKSVFLITKNPKIARIALVAEWIESKNPKKSPCFKAISPNRQIGEGRTLYYRQTA